QPAAVMLIVPRQAWYRSHSSRLVPQSTRIFLRQTLKTAESSFRVHLINGFPVGVGICYDAEFPEVARCLALNGSLLTVFPTAAPEGMLPGQTEPYPDIAQHYIPANALTNLNFCSYSNRAGEEYDTEGNPVLKYSGNSIICNPYGKAMVAAVNNENCLLIADCLRADIKNIQPADTDYLINRRPEIYGALTKKTVPFPYGKQYTYDPQQHKDPKQPDKP
ncbi:MAG: nitrilase-related carbon-nitrogen hydrolase, partial [Endozoicomonas sp.]|uniref:nitrilase-related carbon-nitrogen hydrolase n=1 Tax=Endozoicomonas sp. TaxID=1892382 RepID=UPI003D9BADBD